MTCKLRDRLEPAVFRVFLLPKHWIKQYAFIQRLRRQNRATVAFIVSSLSQWRSQSLFDLLNEDPRFTVRIIIYPYPSFGEEQVRSSAEVLRDYCQNRNIPFVDLATSQTPGKDLRETLNPDIIFYPQPYNFLYDNDLDAVHFEDKLIGYIPYAVHTYREPKMYHNFLSNMAWRMFFMCEDNVADARKVLYNGARNIRIVGESVSDSFSRPLTNNPWKPQKKQKKKIIWAPHFTIAEGTWIHRDSFSWLSSLMLELAQEYQDRVQFAFKPHPRLYTELQKHPDWGTARAKAYYNRWAEGENTQLETGSYIDLFKASDAMIHDCGSFSVEYLFTRKPVLFTTQDLAAVTKNQNDIGREAVFSHYQGATKEDICSFVEDVVLGGSDPMKAQREAYYDKYLRPPGGRSVAENIYREILTGLRFNEK